MARTLDRDAQDLHRQWEDQRCCTLFAGDPNIFSVDKILDIRAVTTEIEYLVAWTGYPAQYNQWVSEKDVTPDLKRAYSQANKESVIKSLKRKQARMKRQKYCKTENSATSPSAIKKENESFEEKPSQSELTLLTAMKKELNEGRLSPNYATLSDESKHLKYEERKQLKYEE